MLHTFILRKNVVDEVEIIVMMLLRTPQIPFAVSVTI